MVCVYSKFRKWQASFLCPLGFWGVLQVIDYGKDRFLSEIPNAAKSGLSSRSQLLQQAEGKCRMYLTAKFLVFLWMLKHLYQAVVCCLKLQDNLSLAELLRDGPIRNRNLLALTTWTWFSTPLPSCHFTSSFSECELFLGDVNYYGFVGIHFIIVHFSGGSFFLQQGNLEV